MTDAILMRYHTVRTHSSFKLGMRLIFPTVNDSNHDSFPSPMTTLSFNQSELDTSLRKRSNCPTTSTATAYRITPIETPAINTTYTPEVRHYHRRETYPTEIDEKYDHDNLFYYLEREEASIQIQR